jgi:hypothetical protein
MINTRLLPALILVAAASCTGDAPTAPAATNASSATANYGSYGSTPGSRRHSDAKSGVFTPINCVPRRSSQGSAVIGPSGGTLWIGKHRLIVPPGALTRSVRISGTVPEGKPLQIDLQPHGLQFRKPAGLILDASSCVNVPTIVYLDDIYAVSTPIPAIYSNWWHTIACPIWHFSGYAILLGEGSGEVSSE